MIYNEFLQPDFLLCEIPIKENIYKNRGGVIHATY